MKKKRRVRSAFLSGVAFSLASCLSCLGPVALLLGGDGFFLSSMVFSSFSSTAFSPDLPSFLPGTPREREKLFLDRRLSRPPHSHRKRREKAPAKRRPALAYYSGLFNKWKTWLRIFFFSCLSARFRRPSRRSPSFKKRPRRRHLPVQSREEEEEEGKKERRKEGREALLRGEESLGRQRPEGRSRTLILTGPPLRVATSISPPEGRKGPKKREASLQLHVVFRFMDFIKRGLIKKKL